MCAHVYVYMCVYVCVTNNFLDFEVFLLKEKNTFYKKTDVHFSSPLF